MAIARFLLVRFMLTAGLLVLAESAFRAGVWEFVAKPDSHAGTSAALKNAVRKNAKHADIVTLGSSRAQLGLDHAYLATTAADYGLTHMNLSLGGTHWLTVGVLTDWLRREQPPVRGGIIATSIAEFSSVGNGAYELGVAYPFKRFWDVEWLGMHVPLDRNEPATFGVVSALFQYRSDVRDLIIHPRDRWKGLRATTRPGADWLFNVAANPANVCTVPTQSLAACVAFKPRNATEQLVVNHCKSFGPAPAQRYDLRPAMHSPSMSALPAELVRLKEIRTRQLREIGWQYPPVVVLMPIHSLLADEFYAIGLHEWALSILQPLADEGVIELLDYTTLFQSAGGTDCRAFFDLYHQSTYGRDELMSRLLPEVTQKLYMRAATGVGR